VVTEARDQLIHQPSIGSPVCAREICRRPTSKGRCGVVWCGVVSWPRWRSDRLPYLGKCRASE
jgi:hypothetical protein